MPTVEARGTIAHVIAWWGTEPSPISDWDGWRRCLGDDRGCPCRDSGDCVDRVGQVRNGKWGKGTHKDQAATGRVEGCKWWK